MFGGNLQSSRHEGCGECSVSRSPATQAPKEELGEEESQGVYILMEKTEDVCRKGNSQKGRKSVKKHSAGRMFSKRSAALV